ncbi:MAG: hypothetical protein ACI9UU_001184, partial [Candidatus Azotimanducaceae bacterium]
MNNFDPQKHVFATYKAIRYGIVLLAFVLPILLAITGWVQEGYIRGSWSAYYFGPIFAAELFIGIVCTLGCLLILYTGQSRPENLLLCAAGGFAFLIAFVPMNECVAKGYCIDAPKSVLENSIVCAPGESAQYDCNIKKEGATQTVSLSNQANVLGLFLENAVERQINHDYTIRHCLLVDEKEAGLVKKCQEGKLEWWDGKVTLHGIAAISFFLCMALVCLTTADRTLFLIDDEASQRQYARTYKVLGILMILVPAGLILFTQYSNKAFFAETAGAWIFAYYWYLKTRELNESRADI